MENLIHLSVKGRFLKWTISQATTSIRTKLWWLIIIYGKDDLALRAVFARLIDSVLTMNKEKCELNKRRLEFFGGHIFSADGVSVDPKRINQINKLNAPTNASEMRSFLAMAQFSARYINGWAVLSEPLRRLTRAKETWKWSAQEQKTFDAIKASISKNITAAYFDLLKRTSIIVDGSVHELCAIMTQPDDAIQPRVISYASRATTEVDSRYSQTEIEKKHSYLLVEASTDIYLARSLTCSLTIMHLYTSSTTETPNC